MIYSLHVVQLELLTAWMMTALTRYLYFRETVCLVGRYKWRLLYNSSKTNLFLGTSETD